MGFLTADQCQQHRINGTIRDKITSRLTGILAATAVLFLAFARTSSAQLSPGELHVSHSSLEGLKNCKKCHEAGNKITGSKCLECHAMLRERIEAGRGLHAGDGFGECTDCHAEHLGRNAELIWWKGGRENFDHRQTGYELMGKHKSLDCRRCHVEKNVAEKEVLLAAGKNLDRTFLGLSTTCSKCHADEHRGQFRSDCLGCHSYEGWKSQLKFDHDNTNYRLTGRHGETPCEKCHLRAIDDRTTEDPDYLKFSGTRHSGCTDCHQIYHQSGFDRDCGKCHSTAGWSKTDRSVFSHADTRYPLAGKHLLVSCEKCHRPGQPFYGFSFSACVDCHADYHRGQFSGRDSKGDCAECHTVDGFSPARFSIDDHRQTDYPLSGSHLAIPCAACHRNAGLDDGSVGPIFVFQSMRCLDCHTDPHKGQVDKYTNQGGCEYCHTVEGWEVVSFDHAATGFKLEGRHETIPCRSCHREEGTGDVSEKVGFRDLSTVCSDCHKDAHRGQFAALIESDNGPGTDCGRCHAPIDWKPRRFEHNRDSAFQLEGAHAVTPCNGCHKSVTKGGEPFILYKSIGSACQDCHGVRQSPNGEAEE